MAKEIGMKAHPIFMTACLLMVLAGCGDTILEPNSSDQTIIVDHSGDDRDGGTNSNGNAEFPNGSESSGSIFGDHTGTSPHPNQPPSGGNGSSEPEEPSNAIGDMASWLEEFSCNPGDHFCDLGYFTTCRDGHYYIADICSSQPDKPICDTEWGCVSCRPGKTYCKGNAVYHCATDGSEEVLVESCGDATCDSGECLKSDCAEGAEFIYLVDDDYNIIKFDPGDKYQNYLEVLFPINCGYYSSTPFSMAVDRKANAWVLYNDSTLFKIDIKTQQCTRITKFNASGTGLNLFGMAFSLTEVGSQRDSLYIGDRNSNWFGQIDTSDMSYRLLAPFPGYFEQTPELTGTGLARLYAFSPGQYEQHITEIDKESGQVLVNYNLPGAGGYVSAWAFAHWGGFFFMMETVSGVNKIFKYDIETRQVTLFMDNTRYRVVGAGVSTCAPVSVLN